MQSNRMLFAWQNVRSFIGILVIIIDGWKRSAKGHMARCPSYRDNKSPILRRQAFLVQHRLVFAQARSAYDITLLL